MSDSKLDCPFKGGALCYEQLLGKRFEPNNQGQTGSAFSMCILLIISQLSFQLVQRSGAGQKLKIIFAIPSWLSFQLKLSDYFLGNYTTAVVAGESSPLFALSQYLITCGAYDSTMAFLRVHVYHR